MLFAAQHLAKIDAKDFGREFEPGGFEAGREERADAGGKSYNRFIR